MTAREYIIPPTTNRSTVRLEGLPLYSSPKMLGISKNQSNTMQQERRTVFARPALNRLVLAFLRLCFVAPCFFIRWLFLLLQYRASQSMKRKTSGYSSDEVATISDYEPKLCPLFNSYLVAAIRFLYLFLCAVWPSATAVIIVFALEPAVRCFRPQSLAHSVDLFFCFSSVFRLAVMIYPILHSRLMLQLKPCSRPL